MVGLSDADGIGRRKMRRPAGGDSFSSSTCDDNALSYVRGNTLGCSRDMSGAAHPESVTVIAIRPESRVLSVSKREGSEGSRAQFYSGIHPRANIF